MWSDSLKKIRGQIRGRIPTQAVFPVTSAVAPGPEARQFKVMMGDPPARNTVLQWKSPLIAEEGREGRGREEGKKMGGESKEKVGRKGEREEKKQNQCERC